MNNAVVYVFVGIIILMVIVAYFIKIKFLVTDIKKEQCGISIFGRKMEITDYLSFVNVCVSYLMIDKELDLSKFVDKNLLRMSSDADFHLLERTINEYPIVGCKYANNYIYKIDEKIMSSKYEKYQRASGNDDYIIPLFDIMLVQKYPDFFNFETRFQQIKNIENVVNSNSLFLNFSYSDIVMSDLTKKHAKHNKKEKRGCIKC